MEINKETFNAICEAATSFKIMNLLENQETIVKSGKITPLELDFIIDKIFDIELNKQIIFLLIKKNGFLSVSEIIKSSKLEEFDVYKALGDLLADNLIEEKNGSLELSYKPRMIMSEENGSIFLKLSSIKSYKVPLEPIIPIIDNYLCCGCGACYSICPVNAITMNETPVVDEDKCIHCGLCWAHCPRTYLHINVLKGYMNEKKVDFNKDINADSIGLNITVCSAQTTDDQIRAAAQDGGVVTSLLAYLFDKKLIDGAIGVTQKEGEPWNTEPILMTSKEDAVKAAGTKYSVACNLAALEKIKGTGLKNIAFVGTPCQVQAMRKYQVTSGIMEELWGNIKYIIGIFCMESFSYPNLIKIVEEHCKTQLTEARKMNIDKGKFFVHRDGDSIEVPIKEVTQYARHACHLCVDLTNELCDVSSGSIGSPGGWNSVITRTKIGEELFQNAAKDGYITTKEIEQEKPFGIKLTKKLSNIKRKKNLKNLKKQVLDKKIDANASYYLAMKKFIPPDEEPKKTSK
ncbi:MAG: Coenzyme F420 hydrogenase/dehydrogenase, beta subunit C-terminal domain [Candidatus Helarchaeota archaeon]